MPSIRTAKKQIHVISWYSSTLLVGMQNGTVTSEDVLAVLTNGGAVTTTTALFWFQKGGLRGPTIL